MPNDTIEQAGDSAAVLAAIEYAEKQAGKSNKAFVRALLQQVHGDGGGRRSVAGARSVIPITPAAAAVRSFKIFEDPRYLANARALAQRSKGRARVIGGARVPATEFLDCVAVGNDSQWGCTGTLIASKVVLTAGHCADFATRIFVGSDVTQPGKVVKVKRRVRHPQYHQGKHNDLLVLILDQKVDGVVPRKFARKATIDGATDGRVMGSATPKPPVPSGMDKSSSSTCQSPRPIAAARSTAKTITSPTAATSAWNSWPAGRCSRATVAPATAAGPSMCRMAIDGCWRPRPRGRPTAR